MRAQGLLRYVLCNLLDAVQTLDPVVRILQTQAEFPREASTNNNQINSLYILPTNHTYRRSINL